MSSSVSANKDNTLGMTSSSDMDHNPAYNISAALTYTTQLVDILAHFLDLRLPNKLLYWYVLCTQFDTPFRLKYFIYSRITETQL